ncbi:MAG: ABC transporter substrate-binding protein, partial [Candidatus Omnitrophota bacterium]
MLKKLTLIIIFSAFFASGCGRTDIGPVKGLRLVSAAPSITEILFALGLDDNIVGVSLQCNYPPEAGNKTKIGTFSRPNIEMIIDLDPDIVFISGLEQAPARDRLKKLGIKTVTVYPKSIDELYRSIELIGELTGRAEKASVLVADMKMRIGRVMKKTASIPP